MQLKEKAAIFVIIFSIFFTLLKFVFYFISGSVAVLSESWHSLTDLITSVFVLLAIRKTIYSKKHIVKIEKTEEESKHKKNNKTNIINKDSINKNNKINVIDRDIINKNKNTESYIKQNKFNKIFNYIKTINPEIQISIVIGIFLFIISILLFRQILLSKSEYIHKPVVTGLVFIFFSGWLYFLYKFKFLVGQKEKSQSLISDAYHSKADMVSSLITGFVLILYHFNINLDKFAGIIIAVNILSFSIEVLFNSIKAAITKTKQFNFEYSTITILGLFFNQNVLKKILLKFNIDIENKKTKLFFNKIINYSIKLIILVFLFIYFSTCFYSVNIGNVAFIERFGKVINKNKPIKSGLHIKLPYPFDVVKKINIKEINYINIGNYRGSEMALIWANPFGASKKYISGDNNFFLPYITIFFNIKNPYTYLYNFKNAKEYLKNISENIITSYFAKLSFYDIVLYKRSEWINSAKIEIQSEINKRNIGIKIIDLIVNNIHPPSEISQTFEQVIASYQKKQELINQGYTYKNKMIPEAQSKSYKLIFEAKSYKNSKIYEANGNLINFTDKVSVYKQYKKIVKDIIYTETLEQMLDNKKLIIIDSDLKNIDLYANFKKFTFIEK